MEVEFSAGLGFKFAQEQVLGGDGDGDFDELLLARCEPTAGGGAKRRRGSAASADTACSERSLRKRARLLLEPLTISLNGPSPQGDSSSLAVVFAALEELIEEEDEGGDEDEEEQAEWLCAPAEDCSSDGEDGSSDGDCCSCLELVVDVGGMLPGADGSEVSAAQALAFAQEYDELRQAALSDLKAALEEGGAADGKEEAGAHASRAGDADTSRLGAALEACASEQARDADGNLCAETYVDSVVRSCELLALPFVRRHVLSGNIAPAVFVRAVLSSAAETSLRSPCDDAAVAAA